VLHGVITSAQTENDNITRNTVVMQCTEEMLKIDPHNADAITSRAEVLRFRGKPNEAIDLLNSGAQHESKRNNHDQVIKYADKIIQINTSAKGGSNAIKDVFAMRSKAIEGRRKAEKYANTNLGKLTKAVKKVAKSIGKRVTKLIKAKRGRASPAQAALRDKKSNKEKGRFN